jgi:hypothetical protein
MNTKPSPSFGKLLARKAFFGGPNGTPLISDGDSARVLFFFNLSGAYNGNERLPEANADAQYIANAVNMHADLVAAAAAVLKERTGAMTENEHVLSAVLAQTIGV